MKVLIATDAWMPQVNGVVRTLQFLAKAASDLGATIDFLTPEGFPTLPLPTYPGLRLALPKPTEIARRIERSRPDIIHVATEGPIGVMTRRYCKSVRRPFTTSYTTRFPEYISARALIPERWTYAALRRFHAPARGTMVVTPTMRDELIRRGFSRVKVWSRGVDHDVFKPGARDALNLPRPIFLCVGRVAVEKNLEALLKLDLPGSTVIVGDGPVRRSLARKYPRAHFIGARFGEALSRIYASADVFVFPSLTDTFGNVLTEALASGLPVAAFPVTGPLDVIGNSGAGILGNDLRAACLAALEIPREKARAHSLRFTWAESARQFLGHIEACQREAKAVNGAV